MWKNNFPLHYIFPPFFGFSLFCVVVCVIENFTLILYIFLLFLRRPRLAFSAFCVERHPSQGGKVDESRRLNIAYIYYKIYTNFVGCSETQPTLPGTIFPATTTKSIQKTHKIFPPCWKEKLKILLRVCFFFYTKWRGFALNQMKI